MSSATSAPPPSSAAPLPAPLPTPSPPPAAAARWPAGRSRGSRAPVAVAAVLALTAAVPAGSASAADTTVADTTVAAVPQQADCTADGFCEDFESQTGTQPAGRWTTEAVNCSGTGAAAVDSAVAHTGSKSLRIDGKAGYCNHVFAGTPLTGLPAGSALHVRFWVRHTTALPAAHVTFAAMHDPNDGSRDLRMGGQNGALQWNRESDDATLPEQSPVGVSKSLPLPVGEWTCVEFRLDGPAGQLGTKVNGSVVEGLVVDGTPTPDIDRQWLNKPGWRPAPTNLRFGWESYGSGDDTLWYDDIAVGGAPIGC